MNESYSAMTKNKPGFHRMELDNYQGQTIERIWYWVERESLNVVTKHGELHFNITAVEIEFRNFKKLTIESFSSELGLHLGNRSLNIDQWDEDCIKVEMTEHPFFYKLISHKLINLTVWWCDNIWHDNDKSATPKSYIQEIILHTENGGYFLASSAEAEEKRCTIDILGANELVIITDPKIVKKHELAHYGSHQFLRYKTPKV